MVNVYSLVKFSFANKTKYVSDCYAHSKKYWENQLPTVFYCIECPAVIQTYELTTSEILLGDFPTNIFLVNEKSNPHNACRVANTAEAVWIRLTTLRSLKWKMTFEHLAH